MKAAVGRPVDRCLQLDQNPVSRNIHRRVGDDEIGTRAFDRTLSADCTRRLDYYYR